MAIDMKGDLIALLPRMRRFARSLTRSVPEADDLVQEACLRALSRSDQWDPAQPLDRWMFRITRNLWISEVRKRSVRIGSGQVPADEANELVSQDTVEEAVSNDPRLQAELDAIMAADAAAREEFGRMLDEPVPFALAAAIRDAPVGAPANLTRRPIARGWMAAAVTAIAMGIGGVGGYVGGISQSARTAAADGWLADIADYHRVYSAESRHLVEVPADEAEHIRTWLTASVGTDVRIPDLSEHALTFRGARLLVAAGKPVAQLMYTNADGRVVALCLIQSDRPRHGFVQERIDGFDMVTWGARDASFVVVGDVGRSDLGSIARSAALQG